MEINKGQVSKQSKAVFPELGGAGGPVPVTMVLRDSKAHRRRSLYGGDGESIVGTLVEDWGMGKLQGH